MKSTALPSIPASCYPYTSTQESGLSPTSQHSFRAEMWPQHPTVRAFPLFPRLSPAFSGWRYFHITHSMVSVTFRAHLLLACWPNDRPFLGDTQVKAQYRQHLPASCLPWLPCHLSPGLSTGKALPPWHGGGRLPAGLRGCRSGLPRWPCRHLPALRTPHGL